ncbi:MULTISPECIES: hypothetical protein [Streptomyces]|uniref:hypothetical protein n=1 Tax=Streptomyces TaxID=1883 RepID=UPI0018DF9C24|nr:MULTISPECIES: hypothetical protein [Streptomyces]MCZ4102167.1 hypothetical protein [Streptomyces sp. H39-C1]
MNRISLRSAVPAVGALSILVVAGCGSSSSATRGSATASDTTSGSATAKSTAPNGAASGGGSGTLTVTGSGGATYHFDKVDCAGRKDPAGDLLTTATSSTASDVTALISHAGGKTSVLMTIGSANPTIWADVSGAGVATYARTADTDTLAKLPVERTGASSPTRPLAPSRAL